MINFNAKQHLQFSLYTLAILFIYPLLLLLNVHITLNFYLIFGVLIGSLLPDVDHKDSIAGALIPAWLISKHMGITHSIVAVLVIIGIYIYTRDITVFGVIIGYTSHLYIDNATGSKLPNLFYPIKRKKVRR